MMSLSEGNKQKQAIYLKVKIFIDIACINYDIHAVL